MPHRSMPRQYSDTYSEIINLRAPVNTDNDMCEKAFNEESFDMEEWNNWMRWEANSTDLDTPLLSPLLDRKDSIISIISSDHLRNSNHESGGTESTLEPYSAATEFPFGEYPLKMDDLSRLSSSIDPGPESSESPIEQRISQTTVQDIQRPVWEYPCLSEAEERSLQEIAMPKQQSPNPAIESFSPSTTIYSSATVSSPSPSPTQSQTHCYSPSASPEPIKQEPIKQEQPKAGPRESRKRKSVAYDDDAKLLSQSRKGHNAIEKRYRTNLNEKIDCLRQGIPSLCRDFTTEDPDPPSKKPDDEECEKELGNIKAGHQQKFGKAAILTRALEYIKDLERGQLASDGEIEDLKGRVAAFEKLARNGNGNGNGNIGAVPALVKSETLANFPTG